MTETQRQPELMLQSEELFHLMVESAKDYAIFAMDTEGRVASWNTGAERLFGYTEAEILGRKVSILFTPEDRERGVPEQELKTAKSLGQADDGRWHLRKDGTRFRSSGMVRPLNDNTGNLRGFVPLRLQRFCLNFRYRLA